MCLTFVMSPKADLFRAGASMGDISADLLLCSLILKVLAAIFPFSLPPLFYRREKETKESEISIIKQKKPTFLSAKLRQMEITRLTLVV